MVLVGPALNQQTFERKGRPSTLSFTYLPEHEVKALGVSGTRLPFLSFVLLALTYVTATTCHSIDLHQHVSAVRAIHRLSQYRRIYCRLGYPASL